MKPVSHPSNTRTLGAPAGWDQSGLPVDALGITDQVMEGVPCVWSFWELSPEERASIAAGGRVILSVVGRTMPPGLLLVEQCPPAPTTSLNTDSETLNLHPATADLVRRFSDSLASKLAAAETKYGYSDGWLSPDWMDECRAKLLEHINKGDPRDVAAYCAFLWHHGERTAAGSSAPALPDLNGDLIEILGRPNFACARIAEVLRHSGIEIKQKAEHEQAAVLHYMLGLYLRHGADWWAKVREDLEARAATIKGRKTA